MSAALRLFIFEGFEPDYTDGLAMAIAEDETHARRLIVDYFEKTHGYEPHHWGKLSIFPITKPIARAISGGS